jgi:glycosyltransferase involved in cell wall biosynthesis
MVAEALTRKFRVILHLHNDPHQLKGTATAQQRLKLTKKLSAIICVSDYIRRQWLEGLSQEQAGKVHVIYNGLNLPQTIGPKQQSIIFAGRLTASKGALEFIAAMAQLLPEYPDWRAYLIGADRHAVSRKTTAYEKLVMEQLHKVGNAVNCTGYVQHHEAINYFSQSEIAVVPSLWNEAFGRTALEALAYGCALVHSGRGGLREVVGSAGVTCTPEPQEIADHVQTLIEDSDKRAALQHQARIQAQQFSIEKCTAELDDLRQAVIESA